LADAYQPAAAALGAMAIVLFLVGVIAVLLIWWRLTALVFRPVQALQRGAESFGRGELRHQVTVYRPDDIGRVAESMNAMAARLQEQRTAIERHAAQLESLYRVSLSLTKRLEVESVLDAVMSAAFVLRPARPTSSCMRTTA
jgi:two-component system sensor histidine kinase BaeS